jgi:NAD(P)H-hydrate epimerase
VTFARRKPGHLLVPGRVYCGPITVADIGIADTTIAALGIQAFANGPDLWRATFPQPSLEAHKYKRGHAVVVSGRPTHTGAARLAARGALRVGAGLVTVASPNDALAANAAQLTAIMLRRCDGAGDLKDLLADLRFNALGLGPALGVGEATRAMVETALGGTRAVVLDADALTSFDGRAKALAALVETQGATKVVLTPHEGEFARLFAGEENVLERSSKLERARCAAALVEATVVLKGPDTVIAGPDGRAAINENGTPYLATAGSGDVLSGIIAGLMAESMPPFEGAAAGVWLHAEAGARFGPGLIAEDLPEVLPAVLQAVLNRSRSETGCSPPAG